LAINERQYDEYRRDLEELVERLPADELGRTVRAKLLDYVSRQSLTDDLSIRQLVSILDRLLGDDFAGYAASIVRTYQSIVSIVNTHYANLGVDVGRDFQRIQAIERTNLLQLGDYTEATIERIAREVREGLIKQETTKELVARLAPIDDKTATYARAIAETQVKRYGRILKQEKARLAEVEYFEYVGPVRDTTRPFCLERVGKTFSLASILAMKNNNLEPVLDNCGGWRCVHDWEPDPFATEENF
jgi:hypothetical protein